MRQKEEVAEEKKDCSCGSGTFCFLPAVQGTLRHFEVPVNFERGVKWTWRMKMSLEFILRLLTGRDQLPIWVVTLFVLLSFIVYKTTCSFAQRLLQWLYNMWWEMMRDLLWDVSTTRLWRWCETEKSVIGVEMFVLVDILNTKQSTK